MSSITTSAGRAPLRARPLGYRLREDGLVLTVLATFVGTLGATAAPYMLQPDSWLTFLGGREIASTGLPHTDSLAVLSHGRPWIDQQWLAQLISYRLVSALGVGATIALFAIATVVTFAYACALARKTASPRSVVLFAIPVFFVAFSALRAQAFSLVLFVPFFAFLCRQSRRPTRLVWISLPVLVLWANLHGTVIVAAALVALLGLTDVRAGRTARGLGLVGGSLASVFATPYGLGILTYYESTMGNPLFKQFISEWAPPTFVSWVGLPFFLAAAAAVTLVARRPRALTLFEIGALAMTLAGALMAQRSVVWFAYAALLLLPALLDHAWPSRQPSRRMAAVLGGAAATTSALALVLTAQGIAAAGHNFDQAYPPAALDAVRIALAADPDARVLADDRTSDWLLYELPQIRGRIAFDGRWEVLSQPAFRQARNYIHVEVPNPAAFMRGYRIFVVERMWNPQLAHWYATQRDLRVLYRGSRVVVYER